ncbi:MAG: ubiquitin-like protein Pup [Candidatus Nanopelagicales bacterium]|jgi:ubiquitin-like protein Pup
MSVQDSSQSRPSARDTESVEVEASTAQQAHRDDIDADVDAILDEIDEVLEANAEDFVKSFVQKGGQ